MYAFIISMKNLSLEGRMIVFKTLAISKILFLTFLTKISYQVVKDLEKISKDYKMGGLQKVYLSSKIVRPQSYSIRSYTKTIFMSKN